MLVLDFDHEMHLVPESFDHLLETGHRGAKAFQGLKIVFRGLYVHSENTLEVGIMCDNRHQIFGPAKIQLDSIDPLFFSKNKGVHRVFLDFSLIMNTSVGNDQTIL